MPNSMHMQECQRADYPSHKEACLYASGFESECTNFADFIIRWYTKGEGITLGPNTLMAAFDSPPTMGLVYMWGRARRAEWARKRGEKVPKGSLEESKKSSQELAIEAYKLARSYDAE